MPFRRLMVANRGEIALRILRSARELGLETVAVYSEADRGALHTRAADRTVCIGPAEAASSYLNIPALIAAAQVAEADAIHPGYGFLSENAAFAAAVIDAGLTWVGPLPDAIAAMGDKLQARRIAQEAGVPTVPGKEGLEMQDFLEVGFPMILKAAGGGGGKGMRRVNEPAELADALEAARSEAQRAFGNPTVYAERFLEGARHVEVQVLADADGNTVHLFERDCSLQRRHQKVVEEAPAPGLSAACREGLYAAALKLCRAVEYRSAGTVEFLVSPDGSFYFLEMNTRIQVEHTVTEQITGLDLVREQLRIAMGESLGYGQAEIRAQGHAIQVRIYAEDPGNGFLPSPGKLMAFQPPEGPGIRVDAGVEADGEVSVWYDPLLAKLICSGSSREVARARMRRALQEFVVIGVENNVEYLRDLIEDSDFVAGTMHTGLLAARYGAWKRPVVDGALYAAAFLLAQRLGAGSGRADTSDTSGVRDDTSPLVYQDSSPWKRLNGWRIQ